MKRILCFGLAMFAAVASAAGGNNDGRPDCLASACSARKSADFERSVGTLRSQHAGNTALAELATKLGQAPSSQAKGKATIAFFGLDTATDANDIEKAIERRLNDGQADKLSNTEVRKLTDVFVGNAE